MAFTGNNNLGAIRGPFNCGGLFRPWAQGTGVVSGVTKIAGAAAACRVSLHQDGGMLVGFRRTASDGVYSFIGLPPGEYYLVIKDDQATSYRAKVEHVVVT